MQILLEQLTSLSPTLSPKLKLVAKTILDNPNAVAITSMRTLAKQAGVTPPTMTRLVEKLGFDSYESFRAVFQQSIADPNYHQRASWLQELADREGDDGVVHQMAKSAADNVQRLFEQVDSSILSNAADVVRKAATAYIVAAGAPHWIAAYMQYVGRMAIPGLKAPRTSGISLMESLIPIKPGDVVLALSFHPYACQTSDAISYAKSRGAKIILITDSRGAPSAALAEILLLVSTDSPQYFPSMVSVVAVLETLIAVIVSRSDRTVIDKIAEFDLIRKEQGIYIETPGS